MSLKSILCKLDLTGCIFPDCIFCKSGKSVASHTRSGGVYTGECKLCRENNKVTQYFGETGSGGYRRSKRHEQEIESRDQSNGFAKHLEIFHQEHVKNSEVFEMRVERTFKKNLDRQCYEGSMISNNRSDILMNSRNEFHGPAVPRVQITCVHLLATVLKLSPDNSL